jgi:thioredoxin reductase (NADPH)
VFLRPLSKPWPAGRAKFRLRPSFLSASEASAVIQEKVVRHPKIDVRFNTEVVAFDGARGRLAGLTVRDRVTRQEERLRPSGVFVFVGLTPNTGFLDPEWMRLDRWGFVVTGHDLVHDGDRPRGFEAREPGFLESSVPGIFAAGDVRSGSTKQVASATGEGASAALMIREHLKAT